MKSSDPLVESVRRQFLKGGAGGADAWLVAAGFANIRIAIKSGSRELVETWAPGRGIEDYVASAMIDARKPLGFPL